MCLDRLRCRIHPKLIAVIALSIAAGSHIPLAQASHGQHPHRGPDARTVVVVEAEPDDRPWYVVVGTLFGIVVLPFTFLVALRNTGAIDRIDYEVIGTYMPPTDILEYHTLPVMEVLVRNRGNVEVALSDFRLGLARIDDVYDESEREKGFGAFTYQTGATLMLDGKTISSVGMIQQFSKINYLTHQLTAPKRSSQRFLVDFEALFPDFDHRKVFQTSLELEKFHPVLMFRSSTGDEFHMDVFGCHRGQYDYPYPFNELDRAVMSVRRRGRWFWKRSTEGPPARKPR